MIVALLKGWVDSDLLQPDPEKKIDKIIVILIRLEVAQSLKS